jgi:hypothetical protein
MAPGRGHVDGAPPRARRAADAVKERDAASTAIDVEAFAGVVLPTHANPDPAHGRHELRNNWW